MEIQQKRKFLLQIALSVTIAAFLLWQLNVKDFALQFSQIALPVLAVILLTLIPSILFRAWRWKLLYEDQTHHIKLSESTSLLLVGLSLNLILPASTGDIVKSYFGYKWSGVKERMLSISLLDKVIALASIALLGIPFALVRRQPFLAAMSLVVFLPAFVVLVLPWLSQNLTLCRKFLQAATRLTRKKLDYLSVVQHTRITKSKLLTALGISILGWSVTYTQLFLCFRALDADVSILFVFSVAPLLTLIRLFPFTLSGIGSDEAGICYLFHAAGISLEKILAAAIIYRFIALIVPGIIGLYVLAVTKRLQYNETDKGENLA
jgi:glycosyltransferase 2 family protein